jgi:glycosyltransferase involved in cell wall biosynthesis
MISKYPKISCVVIGINTARTIVPCLESIRNSNYRGPLEVIYVDGGSTDNSVKLAKSVQDIKVIELHQEHPTPGRGRNVGWRAAKGELVHFFDGDVIVEKDWFKKAVKAVNNETVTVCGYRKESYPNKNWYHRFADIEWGSDAGNIKYFGGDVLIKKSVLEETGGYNNNLIAGEDTELSFRIRKKGYSIKRLDVTMCYHDINMNSIKQYFKRCFRSGYGCAEVGTMYSNDLMIVTIKKIIESMGTITFLIMALMFQNVYFLAIPLMLNIMQIFKIPLFKKRYKLNNRRSAIYALHLIISTYLITIGIFRYYLGRILNKPLTNKSLLKKKTF